MFPRKPFPNLREFPFEVRRWLLELEERIVQNLVTTTTVPVAPNNLRDQDYYTIRTRSTGQNMTSGSNSVCTFSQEDWDPSGMKDAGSQNSLTIRKSGRYRISTYHPLAISAYQLLRSQVRQNSTTIGVNYWAADGNTTNRNPVGFASCFPTVELDSGDVIDFLLTQVNNAGSTITVLHEFTVEYVGPKLS